jgi:lipoprotein-anchoring transpeptidase ErfK/SrfK
MEVPMKRRTRRLVVVGSVLAVAACGWWFARPFRASQVRPDVLTLRTDRVDVPATVDEVLDLAAVESPAPQVTLEPQVPIAPSQFNEQDARRLIARAQSLVEQGQIVEGRDLINAELVSGRLPDAVLDDAMTFLADLNSTILFSSKRYAGERFTTSHQVKPGERLAIIARGMEVPWELLGRLNGIADPSKLRAGQTLKGIDGPFHVIVSKSRFTLDVYLGAPGGPESLYVKTYRVGLGEESSTPTGTWTVGPEKLKSPTYYSPRGEGVIASGDPKNPLGTRWVPLVGVDGQAVGKQSYGIHGTIEPDSIGSNRSMGCIRLVNDDVEVLYDLLTPGKSRVIVTD